MSKRKELARERGREKSERTALCLWGSWRKGRGADTPAKSRMGTQQVRHGIAVRQARLPGCKIAGSP